jgi:hypothetical protein
MMSCAVRVSFAVEILEVMILPVVTLQLVVVSRCPTVRSRDQHGPDANQMIGVTEEIAMQIETRTIQSQLLNPKVRLHPEAVGMIVDSRAAQRTRQTNCR